MDCKKHEGKLFYARLHGIGRAASYLHRRRVHEVEGEQVVDAHGLERQDRAGQVGALDLGHGGRQHLVLVGALRVQAVALAGARAARPARTLLSLRLRSNDSTQNCVTTRHKNALRCAHCKGTF